MSFAAVAMAGAAVVGTVASSVIQAGAARESAETQAESADRALALQREQWQQQRADIGPWREAGVRGLAQMERLARQGPPEFAPFTAPRALDPRQFAFRPPPAFQPPTAEDLARDPSYQFRLAEGQRALERGASARGGLLGGGAMRGLERYAQDYASQEYGNVYAREFGEYGQRYNEALGQNQLRYGRALTQNEAQMQRALQEYQTRYNVGMGGWQQEMAPWQALAGLGGTAATNLGQLGGEYASRAGDLLTGQGAALAAGQIGSADAWRQGLGSLSRIGQQGLQNYYLGQQMQPAAAPGAGGYTPNMGYQPQPLGYEPWRYNLGE
jgi:hypothetical protein